MKGETIHIEETLLVPDKGHDWLVSGELTLTNTSLSVCWFFLPLLGSGDYMESQRNDQFSRRPQTHLTFERYMPARCQS